MKLSDKLNSLDKYPFHMPGHKRNAKFGISGAELDVTEIDGLDNLHCPANSILDIENKLTRIYHSKKSFLLVNGSTVGVLSAIFAVCNRGDEIIIARNCHKSVFNACMLLELRVHYIEPEFDYVDGYYTYVTQSTVDSAVSQNPNAKALVITSPTYEGNISNIKAPIALIVDSAHGAHLGLSYFPSYPKGDIVVSSLHKTLPALTQTAVLNLYNDKYISRAKLFLDMFESSSPSYVLMNSVDICTDYVLNNASDFDDYYARLSEFRCNSFDNLHIKFTDDPSKIVVSTANTNITGVQLADILRNQYFIEVEMASASYVILMTSVSDEASAFDMLLNALSSIDDSLSPSKSVRAVKPPVPQCECVITEIGGVECDLELSQGKISGEYVYAYPPDIPILVPNEFITNQTIDYIKKSIALGVNIVSDSGLLPNKILTKCE